VEPETGIGAKENMEDSPKLLLFAVVLAMACMGFGQNSKPEFSISISAPHTVRTGSSAILDVTLTNISSRTITLSTGDNAHGELNFDIEVRDSEGKPAARTGAWPLSGHLGYVDLKPGKKLKASADIGELFDLKPGSYSVQVRRSEEADSIVFPQQRGSDLRQPEAMQPAQPKPLAPSVPAIKSKTITLTVIP
jgi:hypothetical protein